MCKDLKQFFNVNDEAFYEDVNGEKKFRGVKKYYGDTVRNEKAKEQVQRVPLPISRVFHYVNEFLEMIRMQNGFTEKNIRVESIYLDDEKLVILDNGIIAQGCEWCLPVWNKSERSYDFHDEKYDVIKDVFGLSDEKDIIWLKFTTKGHLGVVAKSFDINFSYKNSSGILVKQVEEKWDESFVLIFPITKDMLYKYNTGEMELAIGNYLIEKGVPIIDYYSHNN